LAQFFTGEIDTEKRNFLEKLDHNAGSMDSTVYPSSDVK
jgi:hypothetical protein